MPNPIALCVERVGAAPGSRRFMRCVAIAGREPGLRLGLSGETLWREETAPAAAELWVSADERLILYRLADAPAVTLQRAGRRLDLPECKPVVTMDQDLVEIGGSRLRLHVHGVAPAVAAPSPLPEPASQKRGLARAAAIAVGSVVAATGCRIEVRDQPPMPPEPDPIEVRDRPPEIAISEDVLEAPETGEATTGEATDPAGVAPIEVRMAPPLPAFPPRPEPLPPPEPPATPSEQAE